MEKRTGKRPMQQRPEGCAGAGGLKTCVAVDDIGGAGTAKGTVEESESERLQTMVRLED